MPTSKPPDLQQKGQENLESSKFLLSIWSKGLVISDGTVNLYSYFWKLFDFIKEAEDVQILQGCQGCPVSAQKKHMHTYTRSPTQPCPKPYVSKKQTLQTLQMFFSGERINAFWHSQIMN